MLIKDEGRRRLINLDPKMRRPKSWIQGKETAFRLSSTHPIYNISPKPHKEKSSATKTEKKNEAAGQLDPRQVNCRAANLGLLDQQHPAGPQQRESNATKTKKESELEHDSCLSQFHKCSIPPVSALTPAKSFSCTRSFAPPSQPPSPLARCARCNAFSR